MHSAVGLLVLWAGNRKGMAYSNCSLTLRVYQGLLEHSAGHWVTRPASGPVKLAIRRVQPGAHSAVLDKARPCRMCIL